jgi:predicted membrane protein
MNHMHSQNRIALGAVIILLGIAALIDSMHIFVSFSVLTFWPTAFIVFGLLKLFQTSSRGGLVVGCFLIGIGIFITLEHMGLFYFRVHDWWPLFLIGAGVLVLTKGSRQNDFHRRLGHRFNATDNMTAADEINPNPSSMSTMNVVSVMSGNVRRNDTPDFRGAELTAVMGGMEIDLRNASMTSEATINVFAIWGGIVIRVPADWTVVSSTIPILGGAVDKTIPPTTTGKRLILDGYVVMGGVEIKN